MTTMTEDRLAQLQRQIHELEERLRVTQKSATADAARDRAAYVHAVEEELHGWDDYLERMQAQAALRAQSTRDQAEQAIRDLRRRRSEVAGRLAAVRAAPDDNWEDQRKDLADARGDLHREADELAERFR
jgi:hypothetical protein